MKVFVSVLLIFLVVSSLVFVGLLFAVKAQSSSSVGGVLNSDTTLTMANSPYTFSGNVLVNNGVTLTIQPWEFTVNFNGFYLSSKRHIKCSQGTNRPIK